MVVSEGAESRRRSGFSARGDGAPTTPDIRARAWSRGRVDDESSIAIRSTMVFLSGFVSADGLTAREMSVAHLQRRDVQNTDLSGEFGVPAC